MKHLAGVLLLLPLLGTQEQPKTFSTEVKVVNVLATVRNKNGEVIRDLKKEDFTLEEDGRPQTIKYFSQESDLPLTLGLLVDTSPSQGRVLDQERRASAAFFDQVLREDKDRAFLIHFDFDVELLKDLTSSRQQLREALTGAKSSGGLRALGRVLGGQVRGGTALYDSVLLASDDLMKKQQGRKALILLTDGVDQGSLVTLSAAIEAAQRADTLVYSILFADPRFYGGRLGRRGSLASGRRVLERLSLETGGGFFEVSGGKHSIEAIYRQIQEELRSQYSLGYSPDGEGRPLEYHRLRVTAKPPGLVVQAREGYYTGK